MSTLLTQCEKAHREIEQWPRHMQINSGVAHLCKNWHENTVSQLAGALQHAINVLHDLDTSDRLRSVIYSLQQTHDTYVQK